MVWYMRWWISRKLTGEVKTKADEKAAGSRPYATMLNPRQVIGWKSKVVKGKWC